MMQFAVPKRSSPSLVVKSNNQATVEAVVRGWARHVAAQRPEVRRIIWFGSRVSGTPAPSSDVGVCVVTSGSRRPVRDRIGDYLPFGIDLFPYTESELKRLETDHPSWYGAITPGVDPITAPSENAADNKAYGTTTYPNVRGVSVKSSTL